MAQGRAFERIGLPPDGAEWIAGKKSSSNFCIDIIL